MILDCLNPGALIKVSVEGVIPVVGVAIAMLDPLPGTEWHAPSYIGGTCSCHRFELTRNAMGIVRGSQVGKWNASCIKPPPAIGA